MNNNHNPEEGTPTNEEIIDIVFNFGFGCDPPKGDKQREAVHDACVWGMEKMREMWRASLSQPTIPEAELIDRLERLIDTAVESGATYDRDVLEAIMKLFRPHLATQGDKELAISKKEHAFRFHSWMLEWGSTQENIGKTYDEMWYEYIKQSGK